MRKFGTLQRAQTFMISNLEFEERGFLPITLNHIDMRKLLFFILKMTWIIILNEHYCIKINRVIIYVYVPTQHIINAKC